MDETILVRQLKRLATDLEADETAFKVVHKHWGRILWPLVGLSFLAALTLAVSFALPSLSDSNPNLIGPFIVILSILYLTLAMYAFSEWYSYSQSALVITNQRIIDYQQINFMLRRVQTIDLHEIQSCVGELSPGWGTIFHYGNLSIHTIGDRPIGINFIPNPEAASGQVMHYHNLIAHGGQSRAHTEAETPKPSNEIAPTTLLMFHIPSESLAAILADLPAQKEPTITYLAKTDYYEVETVVPTEALSELVTKLRSQGAEDIMGSDMRVLSS